MKIAVCVSGVPRSGMMNGNKRQDYNQDFHRDLRHLKHSFPTADFYFGTWKQYEKILINEYPVVDYWLFDEPTAHYHPYLTMNKADMICDKMREFSGIYQKRPNLHERTKYQAHQILCHALMVDKLPKEYDVIVRARFDVFTYAKGDFSIYTEKAYKDKTAIGFGVMKPHWETFNIAHEIDKTDTVIPREYLFDTIIIHNAKSIDTARVFKLHKDKKLCPAEFGWYQVLSQPYNNNHMCVSGWANANRCILPQFLKEE